MLTTPVCVPTLAADHCSPVLHQTILTVVLVVRKFLTHFAESDDWKTPGKKINKPLLRKMLVRLASTKFSVGKDYDMLPYMIRKIT